MLIMFLYECCVLQEEARAIGSDSRGSWKHVLFKVRSEIRKLVGSDAHMGLPQTIRQ